MALLTLPSTPAKDTFQTYELNQADLISLIGEAYYQDKANWQKIVLTYVSSVSNQLSIITFTPDELQDTVSAQGYFAPQARDSFIVGNISIYDKQNGRFRLENSEIPDVSNYEINFGITPPPEVVAPFSDILKSNQIVLSEADFRAQSTDSSGYSSMAYSETPVTLESGKFYKEFTVNATGLGFVMQYFGIRFFTTEPSYFTPYNGSSPWGLPDNEYQIINQAPNGSNSTLSKQLALNTHENLTPWGGLVVGAGSVIGMALDASDPDKGLYFSVNGVFMNSADPATKAGKISIKSLFPTIPNTINAYFFFQMMGQNNISINQTPLYLPAGYTKV